MKQFYQIALVIVFAITASFANANILLETEKDSVSLGASYVNDVYYSFENGEILSVERGNWDIGFYTLTWSAGIITNGGMGVELKLYPTFDTAGWTMIDTAGLSTWPVLYNSTSDWEDGAFNRNATGHPDYGWGVYIPIGSHDVVGDSLYIIKLMDGGDVIYKKLWIERKVSMQNTYYFKYANLDGSDEVNQVINCSDYSEKNFVYYSLLNDEVLDREPDSDTWDILFTKYMGINNDTPYPVTGALNNVDIPANRFDGVAPDFEDYMSAPMDSTKSPIGYDWKYFDMNTFSYVVEDSIAFFVSNFQKDVYKLVFSVFDYTIGNVVFSKSLVHVSAVGELAIDNSLLVYPNPATDFIQVDLSGEFNWEMLTITDLSGKLIYSQEVNLKGVVTIPVDKLNSGVYLVTTTSGQNIAVQKLIIQ